MSVLSTWIVLILLIICLLLGYAVVHLVLLQRKTSRLKHEARFEARSFERTQIVNVVKEFDHLFQLRTGLSNNLIKAALQLDFQSEFQIESSKFLQQAVDSLERILSKTTGHKCAVSIKLLTPGEIDPTKVLIKTYFRDMDSVRIRGELYNDIEPFEYSSNSLFKGLMNSTPYERFMYANQLSELGGRYFNQYPRWQSLFNASAVHLINNPNSESRDEVFGFVCADNKSGGFDSEVTRAIMSIVASVIFYCISASSALEFIQEALEQEEN